VRTTIFSAAMLGQLDVVKAVAASPGVQRIRDRTASRCSRTRERGDGAKPVLAYLERSATRIRGSSRAADDDEAAALAGTRRTDPRDNASRSPQR
jgi:hypothetical protein